jgi:hypothetical protein
MRASTGCIDLSFEAIKNFGICLRPDLDGKHHMDQGLVLEADELQDRIWRKEQTIMRGLPSLNLYIEDLGLGGIVDLFCDLPIAGGFRGRRGDEKV